MKKLVNPAFGLQFTKKSNNLVFLQGSMKIAHIQMFSFYHPQATVVSWWWPQIKNWTTEIV